MKTAVERLRRVQGKFISKPILYELRPSTCPIVVFVSASPTCMVEPQYLFLQSHPGVYMDSRHWWDAFISQYTFRKINMSPEKGPFQKEHSFFKLFIFRGYVINSWLLVDFGAVGGLDSQDPLIKRIGILRTNPQNPQGRKEWMAQPPR